jgi:hypothetical protein
MTKQNLDMAEDTFVGKSSESHRFKEGGITIMRTDQIAIGIAFGALAGGIAAFLFAPKSGPENREMLQGKVNQMRDKVGEVRDRVRRSRAMNEMDPEGTFTSTDPHHLH